MTVWSFVQVEKYTNCLAKCFQEKLKKGVVVYERNTPSAHGQSHCHLQVCSGPDDILFSARNLQFVSVWNGTYVADHRCVAALTIFFFSQKSATCVSVERQLCCHLQVRNSLDDILFQLEVCNTSEY